jgi:hypothetical protein
MATDAANRSVYWLFCCLLMLQTSVTLAQNSTCAADALLSANNTGTTLIWADYFIPATNEGTSITRYSSMAETGALIDSLPLNATAYGSGYNISYTVAVAPSTLTGYNNASYPVLQKSLYLGVPPKLMGSFYSGSSLFSGCAIILSRLPENTNRLAQTDDGSCAAALGTGGCVEALTAKLAEFAQWQVAHPLVVGNQNNLTSASGGSVLPQICNNIAANVGGWYTGSDKSEGLNVIPKECQGFLYNEELGSKYSGPPVVGIRKFLLSTVPALAYTPPKRALHLTLRVPSLCLPTRNIFAARRM